MWLVPIHQQREGGVKGGLLPESKNPDLFGPRRLGLYTPFAGNMQLQGPFMALKSLLVRLP